MRNIFWNGYAVKNDFSKAKPEENTWCIVEGFNEANEVFNKYTNKKCARVVTILSRVWSWLRTNAGGVPNTCKSNEKFINDLFGEI